jgi:hypothetical protein
MERLREPGRAARLRALLDEHPRSAPPPAPARDRAQSAPRQPRQRTISAEMETLRDFFRQEARHTSLRATARAAAVKRSALAKFMAGETAQPNPQTLELMRAFHARRQAELESAPTPPWAHGR